MSLSLSPSSESAALSLFAMLFSSLMGRKGSMNLTPFSLMTSMLERMFSGQEATTGQL